MASPQAAPSGGNLLTQKLGPLATWVWLLIATVLVGIVYLYLKHKQGSSSSTSSGTTATTPASQVPDYIVQNYLGNTPTGAASGGSTTTPPPAGSTPPAQPPPVTTPPPVGTTPVKPARPTQITAPGTDSGDINRIAQSYGLTEAQLIAANPDLKTMKVKVDGKLIKLYGSGQPVPKGTVIKIPALPSK
jgi:hypothetical protein